jgi:ArsR family transcriptional regulator, arsenate/arsenite/antimonite-responsive transcriptional repressor
MTRTAADTPQLLRQAVRTVKAMAHPVRLRILAIVAAGEVCVCQLTAVLGLATSTVSGHLADLRAAGLVVERKTGKWVYYRLARDGRVTPVVSRVLALAAGDPQVEADTNVIRQVKCVPVEVLQAGAVRPGAAPACSVKRARA